MPEKMDNERGGLNDRLKDFQVNPDENLWASLEEKLAQKRKRRPVAIWWFAGAAVFLALLVGTPILFDKFNQQSAQETVSLNSVKETQKSELEKKNESQIVDNQKINEDLKKSGEEKKEIEIPYGSNSDKSLEESKPEKFAEKSSRKPEGKSQIKNSQTEILAQTSENLKNQNHEREERKEFDKRKLSEFTSNLRLVLPEISTKKFPKSDSENPFQSERQRVSKDIPELQAIESNLEKQGEISNSESVSEKAKTKVSQSSEEMVKDSEVALVQPVDSIKKVKGNEEVVTETSKPIPDSSRKNKTQKWQKSVWLAPKFAMIRTIAINQNPDEKRIVLAEENTEWNSRLAFDLGFGMDRKINTWLSLGGFCGMSYLQEQLMISKENILNAYDLVAENGTLSVIPKKEKLSGKLQSQLLAGFFGIGLGLKPSESTTLRLSAGSQFRISETITKEMAGETESNHKSAKLSESIFFIQTSVSQQIPFGKNRLELEPMIQYFSSTVFNLQSGTTTRPFFIGMQLRLCW